MNTTIQYLKDTIENLHEDKQDYYESNHGKTDGHIMWLVGQIAGIELAIKALEESK